MSYLLSFILLFMVLGLFVVPLIVGLLFFRYFPAERKFLPGVCALSIFVWGFLLIGVDSWIPRPPSLVTDIIDGKISEHEVVRIKFLKPGTTAFSPDERADAKSKSAELKLFEDLNKAILSDVHKGRRHRNHPTVVCPERSMEISLLDDSKYLLSYTVYEYENSEFASFDVWPRIPAASSRGEVGLRAVLGLGPVETHYESHAIVGFLREYDPWGWPPNEVENK